MVAKSLQITTLRHQDFEKHLRKMIRPLIVYIPMRAIRLLNAFLHLQHCLETQVCRNIEIKKQK